MANDLKGYRRGDAKAATRRLITEFHFEGVEEVQEFLDEMEHYDDDSCEMDAGGDFGCFDFPDFHDYGFDDYGLDDYAPIVLVEHTWRPGDCYDSTDRGVGLLRYIMDDVRPAEVAGKDITWVVQKHLLISAIVMGGLLSHDFFRSENSLLLGRYSAELYRRLRGTGIEFEPFGDLTKNGWETFRSLVANHGVGSAKQKNSVAEQPL